MNLPISVCAEKLEETRLLSHQTKSTAKTETNLCSSSVTERMANNSNIALTYCPYLAVPGAIISK